MKLNMTLKVKAPPKPTAESSTNEKKSYEDWKFSNSCCLIIMENPMEIPFMQIFPRLRMQKSSCMLLARNIQSFQKMGKMSYLIIIR